MRLINIFFCSSCRFFSFSFGIDEKRERERERKKRRKSMKSKKDFFACRKKINV
jgi:hypothetical protein